MKVRQLPTCAKSYTVGPQQYIPTFFPAGSSGANSCTERVSVLNSFSPMTVATQGNLGAVKEKRKVLGVAHPAWPDATLGSCSVENIPWMDHMPFPLTPALSLRERENHF